MKLKQNLSLIQRQIFKAEQDAYLKRPNPPTPEAVQKAQFVDKTYHWKNAGIRSGDKRTTR
jgi:hypothetical protein